MLRIGILGAADIAPRALIVPAMRRDDVEIVAVAAREFGAAERFASAHRIPMAVESYERLIADPTIDAVYVALPPSEHARWSIRALEAGKHVLCEKPIAFDQSEAVLMAAAATSSGKRLVEAFHDRYHPLGQYLAQLRSSGVLGDILNIEAWFTASNPFAPTAIRHVPELGGGALMDLGTYPIHWVRSFTGEEPTVRQASFVPNPLGADESILSDLEFPSGATATISASMADDQVFGAGLKVIGTKGTIEVDNPVLPHSGHSVTITVDGLARVHTVAGYETYDYQLGAFVSGIETGAPLATESEDFVANMSAIDAVYEAAGVIRRHYRRS